MAMSTLMTFMLSMTRTYLKVKDHCDEYVDEVYVVNDENVPQI